MAKPPVAQRNLFKNIWEHFKNSLKKDPTECLGTLKGEDHFGNKYFELEADPQGGRRYPTRWYESNVDVRNVKIPPEWQGWLRRTRNEPPKMEEIIRNMATARMKKENAEKVKDRFRAQEEEVKGPFSGPGNFGGNKEEYPRKTTGSSFPDYGNLYEKTPGEHADESRYKHPWE